MKRMRDMTLRHRLLLMVLVPVSLLTIVLSAIYLSRGAQVVEQGTRDRGIAIVSFLAPAAEYGVISGNSANLQNLLRAALAQQDVVAAAVYDRSHQPAAVGGTPTIVDLERVVAATDPRLVGSSTGRLAFAAPVIAEPISVDDVADSGASIAAVVGEGEVIGWVYVELDTTSYVQRRRLLVLTALVFALATMVGTGLLAVRLARSVGEPLGRLVIAVRRMAAGDLDVRVPIGGGSQELNALELGFNAMARSIADAHHNLQAKVEEATGKLAYQATHDPLTGLPNRRAFEQALEDAVHASRRAADHGALCFIDLDHFKAVNDSCGHAAGDELLRTVAELVRQRVRAQDLICRIGGDEFALLLRGCSPEDALRIAEDLCKAVEALAFEWEGITFHIGASVGLARIDDHTRSPSDVLKAADIACYEAKRGGRGQVVEHRAAAAG